MSMAQPLNEYTPLTPPVDVQAESVPGPPLLGDPGASARVTFEVSVVTGLPAASWIVTVGWVEKAVPPSAPAGWVEKANFLAAPETPLKAMPTMGLLRVMPPVEPK